MNQHLGYRCRLLGAPLTPVVHIVDDERPVRNAIARLLRAAGYDVAVYASGQQLLDQLPEIRQPGCILMDMLMPGVNGLEVQEHLEKVGSTLPILFMTGSEEQIQSRPEDFLAKPFSKEELLNAIERTVKPKDRSEICGT